MKTIPKSKITIDKIARLKRKNMINLRTISKEADVNYFTLISRLKNGTPLPLEDALKLERELSKLNTFIKNLITKE